MAKKIFINLPVTHLEKAMAFYTAIGFSNNAQFTDETAASMMLTEEIYVMLLTHKKFSDFTTKDIPDAHNTAQVINSLSVDTLDEVNAMMAKVIRAGGTETGEARDYGFMQQRSFEDLDGHLWEVFYIDISKFPAA